MSSVDQRINDTALLLEQQLCRGLGAAPLAQAIRNIKLKALRDGLGGKLPDVSEAVYNASCIASLTAAAPVTNPEPCGSSSKPRLSSTK
eukprot:scaffold128977_cov15-Tisochrysis_lutea.AAC.1